MDPAMKVLVTEMQVKGLDPNDPVGTFEAILSVPTLDRDGEIVDPGAFDPLPDWITIDIDHQMCAEGVVASGVPTYDGDALMFTGTFASDPMSQNIRRKVAEGHLRHMSVAFRAAQYEVDAADERVHIRKAELLNAAIVAIPANRDAAILAAKSAVLTADELTAVRALLTQRTSTNQPATAGKTAAVEDPETAAAPAAASPAPSTAQALAALAAATALIA